VIEIREATPAERARIHERWVRIVRPPKAETDPIMGALVRAPKHGHRMSPSIWHRAIDKELGRLLTESSVLVVDGPVAGEPVGWVVYQGDRLHMVYVFGPARRRGVGKALVEHAMRNVNPRVTYCTEPGRLLLLSVARTRASAAFKPIAPARQDEDDAHGYDDVVVSAEG
jgi:GNAT superfamily N-acetyltransferase